MKLSGSASLMRVYKDALELVSPEAGNAINRAGWYPEDPSIIVMGQGPDAGKTVLDYE